MTSHAISRTIFSEICATTRWAIVSTMSFGTDSSPAIEDAASLAAGGVTSEKELAGGAGDGAGDGAGAGLTLQVGAATRAGPGLAAAGGGGGGGGAAGRRGGGGTGAVVR